MITLLMEDLKHQRQQELRLRNTPHLVLSFFFSPLLAISSGEKM